MRCTPSEFYVIGSKQERGQCQKMQMFHGEGNQQCGISSMLDVGAYLGRGQN
jgi:hypothetical protein